MWYVIQTTTGKEQELVDVIHKTLPVSLYKNCFFMKRQLLKRLGGRWLEVTETLFPAYVFLDIMDPESVFYHLKKLPEFAKLLGDNSGAFIPLEEEEKEFLKLLCQNIPENNYIVGNTKVYLNSSGEIEKMEGPLKYFEDKIIQINLRKRYAIIEFSMRGETQTALLGLKLEKD